MLNQLHINSGITIRAFSKISCLIFGMGIILFNHVRAQDIHFSQFDETPLLLNPANTGIHHDLRVITNYRDQWQSIGAPYKTFAFAADAKLFV